MASKNKIIEMIGSIKTIYPYYAKDTDVSMLVNTWAVLLNDYPDKAVEVAFFKCLQSCKMPPTPADVIEKLTAMIDTQETSVEELWNTFRKAIAQADRLVYMFPFNAVDRNGLTQGQNARNDFERLWNGLPDEIKQYIGGKGELIRLSRCGDEDLKFERNRFFKTIPTIKKRREYTDMLLLIDGGTLKLN